jgi:hypothetical protein
MNCCDTQSLLLAHMQILFQREFLICPHSLVFFQWSSRLGGDTRGNCFRKYAVMFPENLRLTKLELIPMICGKSFFRGTNFCCNFWDSEKFVDFLASKV